MMLLHPETLSGAQAEQRIAQPGLMMLDITAKWCGPCQRLAATLPKFASETAGRMAVCAIDADENRAFVSRWEIQSYPHVMFVRDGVVLRRVEGFAGYAALRGAVDAFLLETTGAGIGERTHEAAFRDAAAAAETAYTLVTTPAAEALGQRLEPVWPAYQATMADLARQREAGELSADAYALECAEANKRIRDLAGPELEAQRTVEAIALKVFRDAMAVACREFASETV